ncbi:Type I Iterative PKS [Pyricularia oryzae]|nr:Type I Iterative PKS [Pyricularia oryzae]
MACSDQVFAYVFGYQNYDFLGLLRSLAYDSSDALLSDFLDRSGVVLKREISRLPAAQQAQCPTFSGIADLALRYSGSTQNPVLSQALTCVAQLGLFIRIHGSGGQVYPTPDTSCVSGVCTGSLAAAAVSCSRNISTLIEPALYAVAVAARIGAVAWDTCDRIYSTGQAGVGSLCGSAAQGLSWSYVVHSPSAASLESALKAYAVENMLPVISTPYISAILGPRKFTVSGPPGIVTGFLSSAVAQALGHNTMTPLDIGAPYHSSVLYNDQDIQQILSVLPHAGLPCSLITIVSSHGQDASAAPATLHHALEEAVRDCLQRQIALDELPRRLVGSYAGKKAFFRQLVVQPVAFQGADSLVSSINSWLPAQNLVAGDRVRRWSAPEPNASTSPNRGPTVSKAPIAILSASGRFPGRADTMDAFWDLVVRAVDTHETVPIWRWDPATHVSQDPTAKNVSGTGFGCWLHQAPQFDIAFFNMSPREAVQTDPAQRLALLTAAEALEKAGIVPERTSSTQKHRVGVWFGATSNDWMETNSAQNIDMYFIPGGNRAFIPGRINYHFKFSGPSYTIDTACSSSLAALHLACNALWRREVDTAIVGGTNVLTNPDMTAGLCRGNFLSRTGNCKTFDETADGYCRGEAVVTVILKRLDDAVADKDPIEACIRGIATNHNAEAESITRPYPQAQMQLFETLLAETNTSPADISYVEMHGTGTQVGDVGETMSVVQTLASAGTRSASNPLYIGSVKSNFGHGEAAAGVTSLAKVLLMMKHSVIPPHAGIQTTINHRLPDLALHNTHIARKPTKWLRPQGGVRRVLINNFSAAGGNTAMILEDAPPAVSEDHRQQGLRSDHVVALSAKTPESLVSNLRNMIEWLDRQDAASDGNLLGKLSYTTTSRRMHYPHRIAVTAADLGSLRSELWRQLQLRTTGDAKMVPSAPQRAAAEIGVILAFTGQGSIEGGLCADLYDSCEFLRADVQRCEHLVRAMGLPSILGAFQRSSVLNTSSSPLVLQLSHVCYQMALSNLWRHLGLVPKAVVGHSLGEYAAMYAAGILSQADTINLVASRARLMEELLKSSTVPHAMVAVMASEAAVTAALGGNLAHHGVSICCRNSTNNVVLGGPTASVVQVKALLEVQGNTCHLLHVQMAFHTAQVEPILDAFLKLSSKTRLCDPKIAYISPTLTKVVRSASDFGPDYFVRHCREPVDLLGAVTVAKNERLVGEKSIAVEIGPAPVICRMVKEVVGEQMQTFTSLYRHSETWKLLGKAAAGIHEAGFNLDWDKYHEDFPQYHQVLQLPTYAWTLKDYWIQYVNDWSLRKGEPAATASPTRFFYSSIYKVVKNNLQNDGCDGLVVVDLDLNSEKVHSMAQGHKVYDVPLCTPSVYADVAFMIGDYVSRVTGAPDQRVLISIDDMHIHSALVADKIDKQILRTEAKFDKESNSISCIFTSLDTTNQAVAHHADCKIHFSLADSFKANAALDEASSNALRRFKELQSGVGQDGNTYRFSRSMIYKMIRQLAEFDPKYRGLSAITLNNNTFEAAGKMSFKELATDKDDGDDWFSNPAHLDAIAQLGGFVMNANEGVDLDKEIFVNHGWKSMKLLSHKLDADKDYYSYVQMHEGENKVWIGTVYVFDEQLGFFGCVRGVELQGVPKRLMQYILQSANQRVSGGIDPASSQPKHQTLRAPAAKPQAKDVVRRESPAAAACDTPPLIKNSRQDHEADRFWQAVLGIMCEEVGIERDNMSEDKSPADLGIDSLLWLVICGRLRSELDLDLNESVLLQNCVTLADVRLLIRRSVSNFADTISVDESLASESAVSGHTPPSSLSSLNKSDKDIKCSSLDLSRQYGFVKPLTPAWSIYLQGSRGKCDRTLFLFPDGCGAATSYTELPTLGQATALVAFNSQFVRNPSRMCEYSLEQVVDSYTAGLRSCQPSGPYHLGGWSAGGILAFAVAARLISTGEAVASLTLLDSPPPNDGLDCLPTRFYQHCTEVGIFANEMRRGFGPDDNNGSAVKPTRPAPEWLMAHFRASTELLSRYRPAPLPAHLTRGLKVNIIWAAECPFDGLHYPALPPAGPGEVQVEGMKFLTEKRTDFGPGRWAELFPGADIRTGIVQGEHHFSMMRGRGANRLVQLVRAGLDSTFA